MAEQNPKRKLEDPTYTECEKPEHVVGNLAASSIESPANKRMRETEEPFKIFESKCEDILNVIEKSFNDFQNEMKRLESAKKKLDGVHFLDVVTLNVGGEKFQTGLQTLKKYPGSLFTTMFSSTQELKKDQDGSYFIDRDGTLFRYLMSYLRTGKTTERMKELAEEIIEEARFFGLPALEDALTQNECKDGVKVSFDQQLYDEKAMDFAKRASVVKEIFKEAKRSLYIAKVGAKDNLSLLEEKERHFREMTKKLTEVHFSEIVTLNVGGKNFKTSISTLQKDPNSMLAAMFSGSFNVVKQKDGAYFIDRDGTHFRHILNFLRTGRIAREVIEVEGGELEEEAEFYNLPSLVETIAMQRPVTINNDGEILTTTMGVLKRHGFAASFSNLMHDVPQVANVFLLSQKVEHLSEILLFLKDGKLSKDQLQKNKVDLFRTATDLNFKYLQNYLTDFTGSKIIGGYRKYIEILKKWLRDKTNCPLPCLIYSTDEQGWEDSIFLKHCSKKGPTLLLIVSDDGCIFGGYTSCDWFDAINSTRGMMVLEKSAFIRSFEVQALRIDAVHCNKMRKALARVLLKKPRFKDIVEDVSDKRKKLLLFDPIVAGFKDLKDEEQNLIKENSGQLVQHTITCTYDHYTADEILSAVLPKEMEVTTSFETVGHIAHMNLRDCQLPFKNIIGEVILDKNPNIKTVVNKTNTIEETFRFFKMELLAGEDNMLACVKQHGCSFEFDFSKVYWNSRLQTEHQRIVNILKPGDVVCDVFAGVGPFAIPAAKKGCRVHANDLNPESHKALKHNVSINKVTRNVVTYNRDGRDFLRHIFGFGGGNPIHNVSHVIMNLPAIAIEFLDVFKDSVMAESIATKGMTIHCYCFSKMEDPFTDVEKRVKDILGCKVEKCEVHMVRNVAPKKVMMCVSFQLVNSTASGDKENEKKTNPDQTEDHSQKRGLKRPAED